MRQIPLIPDRRLAFRILAFVAVFATSLTTVIQGAAAYSTPMTVLSGQSLPSETATTATGDLYFIQFISSDLVTLSLLKQGRSAPIKVYELSGNVPYINDIHFDPAGNLIFITSVATSADGTARHWDLTRLNPSTGAATVLATSSGESLAISDPAFNCIGPGCGLASGTEIDFTGVSGNGTIYFAEHSQLLAAQSADLLALDPGSSTPRVVEHLKGEGNSSPLIFSLTVAKSGEVYLTEKSGLYELSTAGTRLLLSSLDPALHVGLDNAGNLYMIERTLTDVVRFGCAKSTSVRIARISAKDLKTSHPTSTTVSVATYDGFFAGWDGSSSFFRVSPAGDVYWYLSHVDCSSGGFTNEVFGTGHGQKVQTLLYQEEFLLPTAAGASAAVYAGPIGLATFGGAIYFASITTGSIYRIRR